MTLTGSSTTCTHPEYQFFIQSPGGSFVGQSWQPWNGTATATFNWATQGLGPGIYGIGVWARESGSAANYEAYAVATYTLTGICSTASIADSTSGISSPGTAVSFTASATDCGTKQISFRFWALVPGRSTWVMIQDYSTNPTFNWTAAQTSGSPQGTYQIGVWARAPGSTNSYDAYTIITHVLRASCGTAAISAAPGAGNVTLTATAAGCTGALFRFWVFDTTGTWTMVQDFSTINSFTMNTMTATKGHYQFGVWVKDPNSTNTYDSYAIITFYVT